MFKIVNSTTPIRSIDVTNLFQAHASMDVSATLTKYIQLKMMVYP
jgi:hypothetical protein